MNGKVGAAIDDDAAQYGSLVISNIPRLGDKCFPPNPTSPWLEMHAQSFRPIRSRGELKRNVLLADPRQHVQTVELTCSSDAGRFEIIADGQVFGPFYKIRISPHVDDRTKKQFTFPIQTFFPMDV